MFHISLDRKPAYERTFAGAVFSLFMTQWILLFFQSANAIITARLLGPEGKGIYTVCLLIPAVAYLILSVNIKNANTYLAARYEYSPAELFSFSFFMAGIISILSFILFMVIPGDLIAKAIPNFVSDLWIPVGILFTLTLSFNFLLGLLLGWHLIRSMNIARIAQAFSTSVFLLSLLVFIGEKPFYAVVAVALGTLTANILLVAYSFRHSATLSHRVPGSLVKENLTFGVKGYAGSLFQFFNYRFDIFLVNYFLSASQVGLYAVAVSLAELLWYLPNNVASILFSRVARQRDEYPFSKVKQAFRLTWAIVGIGILCFVFLSKGIIVTLFGESFADSYAALLWLLPGVFCLSTSKVMTGYFNGKGLPQYGSISSGVSFFVTIVADIYFIPRLGIKGAAIASSVSYAVGTIIVLFFFIKKTSIPLFSLFTFCREDWGVLFNALRGSRQ